MKYVIEFCPIDAKDNSICGYSPVAVAELKTSERDGKTYPEQARSLPKKNIWLEMEATREYLTKLHVLQEEIKKKYEPLLVQDGEPFDDTSGVYWKERDAYKEELRVRYPGEEARYYT